MKATLEIRRRQGIIPNMDDLLIDSDVKPQNVQLDV